MPTPQQLAPYGIALAVVILLWRIGARVRRTIGRQRLQPRRVRFSAYFLPFAMVLLMLGASSHPWNAAAQFAGIALGVAAASYSIRTSRFEVVNGEHFYTPNPYVGTAVVALFLGRLLYRLALVYTTTGAFTSAPESLVKSPLSVFTAGLMLGFYSWQAWHLLRWHKATHQSASAPSGA
jgi:hypothetical protein